MKTDFLIVFGLPGNPPSGFSAYLAVYLEFASTYPTGFFRGVPRLDMTKSGETPR